MVVSEEAFSGDPSYKEKNVIKSKSCEEFINQNKKAP
tara:strand:- start:404 stop:514 length:111 start_codon:yes stop_codon:yes gene_type:complete